MWGWGGVEEWEGVVDLGRGGCFMIKIPLKMNRHKENQIAIKIENFSQKGPSSQGCRYHQNFFFWSRIPRIPKNFLESHVKKLGIPKHVFCWNPRCFFGVFFGIPQNPRNFCFLFCNPGGLLVESQLATHAFFSES